PTTYTLALHAALPILTAILFCLAHGNGERQNALVAAPKNGQGPVRRHFFQGLYMVKVVPEFGTFGLLTLDHGHLQLTFLPDEVPDRKSTRLNSSHEKN